MRRHPHVVRRGADRFQKIGRGRPGIAGAGERGFRQQQPAARLRRSGGETDTRGFDGFVDQRLRIAADLELARRQRQGHARQIDFAPAIALPQQRQSQRLARAQQFARPQGPVGAVELFEGGGRRRGVERRHQAGKAGCRQRNANGQRQQWQEQAARTGDGAFAVRRLPAMRLRSGARVHST